MTGDDSYSQDDDIRDQNVQKNMASLLESAQEEPWRAHDGLMRHLVSLLACHAMVTLLDGEGRLLFATDAFFTRTGYDPDELLGRPYAVLRPDGESEAAFAQLWRGAADGDVRKGLVQHRGRDGDAFWLESTFTAFPDDADDQECRYIGIHTDVTRAQLAESVLACERALLEALRDGRDLRLAVDDFLRHVEGLRPRLRLSVLERGEDGRLYHVSAPSLPRTYVKAVDGMMPGPEVGSCGAAVALHRPVLVADIARHENWKSYADLVELLAGGACWSWPILGSGGRVLGSLAAYRQQPGMPDEESRFLMEALADSLAVLFLWRESDKRQRRTLEQEKRLRRRQREVLRLLAHELRTPLNHILGFADLLQGHLDHCDHKEWAAAIKSAGLSLLEKARTSEDLLLPTQARARRKLRPGRLLRRILRRWQARYPHRRPPDIEIDDDCLIAAEPRDIQRILHHLLDNIAKFTQDHVRVRIRLGWEEEQVVLRVEDEGPGSEVKRAHELMAFFSVGENTLARRGKGLGLGLAAVRHLVHRNRGQIRIDTAPGQGFRVEIRWPGLRATDATPTRA